MSDRKWVGKERVPRISKQCGIKSSHNGHGNCPGVDFKEKKDAS